MVEFDIISYIKDNSFAVKKMTKVHKLIILLINSHLLEVFSEFGLFLVGFTTGQSWSKIGWKGGVDGRSG